jgi:hypothetical protein
MHKPIDFKYRAFLSYSHADTVWAKWLHKRLETFPLGSLAGHVTEAGEMPKQLRPIFRDREDFSAGHTLNNQTIAALDASAALIVLCSPAVATDGPTAIPIAADLREDGDGRNLAFAKTVATLIGVPSDEVYRRAERERRRQARVRNAVAAIIFLLAGAGAFLGWQTQQRSLVLIDTAAACSRYLPEKQAAASPLNALDQCISALHIMQRGAASDPRNAEILKLIGQGKKQEAERLQVEAAKEDEAAGVARTKKSAERYRAIAATAGLADPKKARENYAKAAKLDPENINGMLWHAYIKRKRGSSWRLNAPIQL